MDCTLVLVLVVAVILGWFLWYCVLNICSRLALLYVVIYFIKFVFKVGDKVTIRSMVDSSKICGVGVVRNLDPTAEVGDIPLGSHWCEVHVNVPVENDEELMRPYHNFLKIGDAIGVAIAWPINLVIFLSYLYHLVNLVFIYFLTLKL